MAFKNPYAEKLGEFSSFIFDLGRGATDQGAWRERFRGASPERLVLEIGCSNGEFLTSIAKDNPKSAFVGVDWKFKIIYKGGKRIVREKLANIVLLRARAQDMGDVFKPGELDELWVFFPDPWAKTSQLKHRLIQEKFLLEAARWLKPGGRVFFKTDHPGYFQWVLSIFGQPQPELPDYDSSDPGERSYRARQVKVRRLEEELPPKSEAVLKAFRFDAMSIDYWADAKARAEKTLFTDRPTLFEKTFLAQKLPIYYVSLTKGK